MHLVSENTLGIPQSSRDAFEFLGNANIIDASLAMKMKAMVGFRNIAVHDYQALNLDVIRKIIEYHLDDLIEFTKVIVGYSQGKTTRQNN